MSAENFYSFPTVTCSVIARRLRLKLPWVLMVVTQYTTMTNYSAKEVLVSKSCFCRNELRGAQFVPSPDSDAWPSSISQYSGSDFYTSNT